MPKVFFAENVDGNMFLQGLLSEGQILKFGTGGKYRGKYPMAFDCRMHLREVDVISILNVENKLELGYVINGMFNKAPIYLDILELSKVLNSLPNIVFCGRREGYESGIKYTQYLYGIEQRKITEPELLRRLSVENK